VSFQQKKNTSTEINVMTISLKKIRKVCIGRDGSTGNIVLYVYLHHPPNLFRKGYQKLSESVHVTDAYNTFAKAFGFGFGFGAKSNFLWSLVDDCEDDKQMRTTDRTSNGAFGRCLLYRLILNSSQLQKLISELQDFALLPRSSFMELATFNPSFVRNGNKASFNWYKICLNSLHPT